MTNIGWFHARVESGNSRGETILTRATDREFTRMDENGQTVTLRHAALIAGFSYLLMPVSFAEFYIYPKLVIRGDIARTAQNISTHGSFFAAAIITLVLDIIIAWALL